MIYDTNGKSLKTKIFTVVCDPDKNQVFIVYGA